MSHMKDTAAGEFVRAPFFLCEVFVLAVLALASSTAQHSEIKFERDRRTGQVPVGFTPRSILVDTSYVYHRWFNRVYSGYRPDSTLAEQLKEAFTEEIEILVFYGTWCNDTRRELPRLMKILDTVDFPEERIKLCGVNRAKQSGDDLEKKHDIKLVPTVIVYRDGEELGRIIEAPERSLESDMIQILKGKLIQE